MVRHIVMWKVKDEALGLKKWELMAELKFSLEGLVGKVAEIRQLQVGLNVLKSDTACDLVLTADFDDLDALQRYVAHPDHQKVADYVKQIVLERRAVDFEFI